MIFLIECNRTPCLECFSLCEMVRWDRLPSVALHIIFQYLDFDDVISASSTCKLWRDELFHPDNWNFICLDLSSPCYQREFFLANLILEHVKECMLLCHPALESDSAAICTEFCLQKLTLNRKLTSLTLAAMPMENPVWFKEVNLSQCDNDAAERLIVRRGLHRIDHSRNTYRLWYATEKYRHNCRDCPPGIKPRIGDKVLKTEKYTRANKFEDSPYKCLAKRTNHDWDEDVIESLERKIANRSAEVSRRSHAVSDKLLAYLLYIIESAENLQHLSLGFLKHFQQYRHLIISKLADHHQRNITSLHISNALTEMEQNMPQMPKFTFDFGVFVNLTILSIDMNDVSDAALKQAYRHGEGYSPLRRLKITINAPPRTPDQFITRDTWRKLTYRCPGLEVTIHVIRCPEVIRDLESYIPRSVPLCHLKLLFNDEINLSAIDNVSQMHGSYLRSFTLVENFKSEGPIFYDDAPNPDLDRDIDPLVQLAWTCSQLREVIIIGIAVWSDTLLGMARMLGPRRLTSLVVVDDCILPYCDADIPEDEYMMPYDRFVTEVNCAFKGYETQADSTDTSWRPLHYKELPQCITEDDIEDPSEACLSLLLGDHMPPEDMHPLPGSNWTATPLGHLIGMDQSTRQQQGHGNDMNRSNALWDDCAD